LTASSTPGYPDADLHATPAREHLAAAARLVNDAIASTAATDDIALEDAAARLESVASSLRGAATSQSVPRPGAERRYRDYLPRSPLVGSVSPLAPGGSWTFADDVLELRVTFGAPYEGPPGYLHGGFVALAFDELLGMVTVFTGQGGLTGKLSVRYRRPTPLNQELCLRAWVDHRQGRRMTAKGTIHAGDELTAEAEGLFVTVRRERAAEYFA